MSTSRRSFLKFGLIAVLGILSSVFYREGRKETRPSAIMASATKRWGMLIDLGRCDGCGACTKACYMAHFVPEGQEWIKIYKLKDNPDLPEYFFVRPCMHCEKPPCVKVCPVKATYRRADGITLIDNTRCIGCRMCMAACPYGARYFTWQDPPPLPHEVQAQGYSPEWGYPHKKGTVGKCVFCYHLSKIGQLPPCVVGCPKGAIFFGDLNEDAVSNGRELLRFSETITKESAYRYREELGTHPRVYYLPPRKK
ncbi:MAG: sulfate reduction electron transfer complex DsrMKJOP subunit DsrO [Candidatus Heimdallarchaeota archaeon]